MVLQLLDGGLLIEPAPAPKPLANHVNCCCSRCVDCPDEIQVTFSGVLNNDCGDCVTEFDDVPFVLARDPANPCLFIYSSVFACECPDADVTDYVISLLWAWDSAPAYLQVDVQFNLDGAPWLVGACIYKQLFGIDGLTLCGLDDPITPPYVTGNFDTCDFRAASCTVEVVPP